jgi:hypothetical protein
MEKLIILFGSVRACVKKKKKKGEEWTNKGGGVDKQRLRSAMIFFSFFIYLKNFNFDLKIVWFLRCSFEIL